MAPNDPRPPVLFIHGAFGRPSLLKPWTDFFGEAGFDCVAPALPGREPSDDAVLRRSGIGELYESVLRVYDGLAAPPVIIGHSLGGLLAQKLAAARDPRAVVLLASVPPGILWPQLKPLPHLAPLMPSILAGRPILPSPRTMREVPLCTLPAAEQDALVPQLVRDSGRVYRQMLVGASVTRVNASEVTCPVLCVSAGEDRNVASSASRQIAKRYGAEHQAHPGLPHWIIAESALDQVAPPVLEWLARTIG
ncbi:MAG: alpha/beta hydrolase [Mycobacterium sp.]|nr:MAG: alpha/beta hydrolase [Mycobacterium sp.]